MSNINTNWFQQFIFSLLQLTSDTDRGATILISDRSFISNNHQPETVLKCGNELFFIYKHRIFEHLFLVHISCQHLNFLYQEMKYVVVGFSAREINSQTMTFTDGSKCVEEDAGKNATSSVCEVRNIVDVSGCKLLPPRRTRALGGVATCMLPTLPIPQVTHHSDLPIYFHSLPSSLFTRTTAAVQGNNSSPASFGYTPTKEHYVPSLEVP